MKSKATRKTHKSNSTIGALAGALLLMAGPAESAIPASQTNLSDIARSAAMAGELAFHLTTPAELKTLLGASAKELTQKRDDGSMLTLEFQGVQAVFAHFGEGSPYTLIEVVAGGTELDIGKDRLITLRNIEDLAKLDTFFGMANVSLAKLDLRDQLQRLNQLPFDSRTQWPQPDKLPEGFEPAKLLEDGKNPGLGVRALHSRGIDGRGIHIAIIDQPLLREHQEYKDQLVDYSETEVNGVPPQMHGSPVTSIAVGKTCGTAPAASVHYYAVPSWKWFDEHCKPYAALLERIVQRNRELPPAEKVRVVSLSLGMFSQWPDHELWAQAVQHAETEGILVVTCDPAYHRLAILQRRPGLDPDKSTNYTRFFGLQKDVLGVPAGNRTTASHSGPKDYVFWRQGGMSWTVPYLAGVAALAYQLDPDVNPRDITSLWLKTAAKTSAGMVVDPPAFVEAVKKAKSLRQQTHVL